MVHAYSQLTDKMAKTEKLRELLDRLIKKGTELSRRGIIGSTNVEYIIDNGALKIWAAELKLFVSLAGSMVEPWREELKHNGGAYAQDLRTVLASLLTIQYALDAEMLTRYEDLIVTDIFGDLIEQGDYLFEHEYFLAAGVIYRAVLEERLRRMCERHGCPPGKDTPTINDYNMALYKTAPQVYDKAVMQHVTAIATLGNNAAHNAVGLTKDDVRRLQSGLKDFLAKHSD
jgi:hypothetical protein